MTRRAAVWAGMTAAIVALVVALVSFPSVVSGGVGVIDTLLGPKGDPVPVAGADLNGSGPGSLVSAMTMPGFLREVDARRMRAARVVYRSTSSDGAPTVVSGSVFVPGGDPPPGGWPTVSFGHGTTGLDEPCAPSLSDSLLGNGEQVVALAMKGYAVAFADYQGLGTPGVHPYTDSRTAGLNMIDAVRALRTTFAGVSKRWGAYGGSQGGGAAWAADEQAGTYAPELELVGAVAISPVTRLTGLVDKAQQGTLTTNQAIGLSAVIESLARLHPEINRDDYRRGAAARYWAALVGCAGPDVHDRTDAVKAIDPHDVAPRTPEAADKLRKHLAQWALPQQRLSAPLRVWYGGTDTFIDARWTHGVIQRACAMGGAVVVQFEKDKGHSEAEPFEQLQWLTDRFERKPVTNDCP